MSTLVASQLQTGGGGPPLNHTNYAAVVTSSDPTSTPPTTTTTTTVTLPIAGPAPITPVVTPRDDPSRTPSPTQVILQASIAPTLPQISTALAAPPQLALTDVASALESQVAAATATSNVVPASFTKRTPSATSTTTTTAGSGMRLNKFVRRLHDMLQSEQNSGIVEWRRGLLVLHSTDAFAKTILPKYFNTRNFKTFRRQLNYYGFVHVRSFSTTGSTTTALWVNQHLAKHGSPNISSVLMLKRVEPCESAKTAEGRRVRKELAVSTVEDDIGVSAKTLQLEQIRSMALRQETTTGEQLQQQQQQQHPPVPLVVHCHHHHQIQLQPSHHHHHHVVPQPPMTLTPSVAAAPPVAVMPATIAPPHDSVDDGDAANLLLLLSKGS